MIGFAEQQPYSGKRPHFCSGTCERRNTMATKKADKAKRLRSAKKIKAVKPLVAYPPTPCGKI